MPAWAKLLYDIFNLVFPAITFCLGILATYFLQKKMTEREIQKRRIENKENAYGEIISTIHKIFDEYKSLYIVETINIHDKEGNLKLSKSMEVRKVTLRALLQTLSETIYKYNIHLKPEMFRRLSKLHLSYYKKFFLPKFDNEVLTLAQQKKFAESFWDEAKEIISDMRADLGFETYPKEMTFWE